jgi:ABC-type transporter Mla subunit MlaD
MNENLTQTLQDLHQQLEAVDRLKSDEIAQLRQAVSEIQNSLDRQDIDSANLAKLFHQKTEAIAEAYPALTRAAGQVADMLSQMGI